ncbi:hypothetical protein BLX24_21700 [Arsenicibacter rosenii]|uniref:Dystroglycan-type cadherin-like domain-containing protein n=1 Tax=Arsenicibacter rosenii TaxID=1750698 RepID=A0A1S2VE23_9BACT|nr:hypothetical protein BLX24_21700 [Arsenicibacter rosenii]
MIPLLAVGVTALTASAQTVIGQLKQRSAEAKLATVLLPPDKAFTEPGNGDLKTDAGLWSKNGLIAINAYATDANASELLSTLQAAGLQGAKVKGRSIFGFFPQAKLGDLKNLPGLAFVSQVYKPRLQTGSVNSQGDRAMRADMARAQANVTGKGVKVGILSDSFDGLGGAASGVASGDLPPNVQVLEDYLFDDATDEGRAMAEIVHDVAPGADIAFHTAFNGQEGFAEGIIKLAEAGCKVIVDDIIYFAEPMFQDGIVAQAVDYVVKKFGVSYFSAAGNNGRNSYEAPFKSSGRVVSDPFLGTLGVAHDFGTNAIAQRIIIPARGSFDAILQWTDSFYALNGNTAKTDLDLLVYYNNVLRPDLSSLDGNSFSGPFERISVTNATSTTVAIDLVVVRYSGPNPARIKWVNFGSNVSVAFDTKSGTSYGHANAENAIAVGAARYTLTPAFNTTLAAPVIETFSSGGGVPILFDGSDAAISAVYRRKPEIVAPDGGNTTFFYAASNDLEKDGIPNFFGTSAAAPHAAAVGALLIEKAKGNLSPVLMKDYLQRSTLDMDDPLTPDFDTGFDYLTGYGLIQADKAMTFIQQLALVQPQFDCQTGKLTFQTTGGDGSPIDYMAIGVTGWTTNPTHTIEAAILGDPNTKVLNLMARQNGQVVSYLFNFRTYCQGSGANQPPVLVMPLTNQVVQLGAAFSFQIPVNTFADPNNDGLTYGAIGLPAGLTFNAASRTISGTATVSGNYPVIITATDPGNLSAQAMFNIIVSPTGGMQPLVLTAPLYDCATGAITFRTTGGDGSPINYIAIGVQRASLSNPTGIVEPGLRADPKPLMIYATQNGVTVNYTFNFAAFCSGAARITAGEPAGNLTLTVLENPTNKEQVAVEVQGAVGNELTLRMMNAQGELLHDQVIQAASATERRIIPLKRAAGIYFVQAISGNSRQVVKVIKQ